MRTDMKRFRGGGRCWTVTSDYAVFGSLRLQTVEFNFLFLQLHTFKKQKQKRGVWGVVRWI